MAMTTPTPDQLPPNPAGMGGPPPGGPGMGGPPPGGPGPDDLMAAEQANAEAKVGQMMHSRPTPSKPYSISAVSRLASEANKAIDSIAGADIPLPEWEAPSGSGKFVDPETKEPLPLPGEVFLPVSVLVEAIKAVDVDGDFQKYGFDPSGLTSDAELKVAASKLRMAGQDKALATALMQPQGGADTQDEGAGMDDERLKGPDEMSEDEEMLSENL